ncbi:MAG: hypothetical protein SFV15_11835 [Polyangiaceae bacterium]|nr:hypothetical protein [Polyangiaceae bacterium]
MGCLRTCVLCLLAFALYAPSAPADTSREASARAGLEALKQGAPTKAIENFELASDRGLVTADLSYNRALAYLSRAKSPQAAPGDLGQAAAGLEEALLQNPKDADAERALDALRAEIARLRAKARGEALAARPSIGRAIVGLAPRAVWDCLALAASILVSLGLLLRGAVRRADVRLAAGISLGLGMGLLLLATPLAYAARWLSEKTEPAVIISPEARLLDEMGARVSAPEAAGHPGTIPEGALVYVHEKAGNLAKVEWGATLAWVSLRELRILRE